MTTRPAQLVLCFPAPATGSPSGSSEPGERARSGKSSSTRGAESGSLSAGQMPSASTTCGPASRVSRPSTPSAEVHPANPLAKLVAAAESTTRAGSGRHSLTSFASWNPESSSWRTSQVSLPSTAGEPSESCSVTWPRSGTMRAGRCYPLASSASGIVGSASSSSRTWPTATATDSSDSRRVGYEGAAHPGTTLLDAARGNWATPAARDAKGAWSLGSGRDLSGDVGKWTTPCAADSDRGASVERTNPRGGNRNLTTDAHKWATPRAHDAKDCGGASESARKSPSIAAQAGGRLNPDWVEQLMGLPIGWTDPDCAEPRDWPGPVAPPGAPQFDDEPERLTERREHRRRRLKAIGNAVVPQCAEAIGLFALMVIGAAERAEMGAE